MFDKSAELYDLFVEWKDYRAEAETVGEIVAARAPTARTLLDVACGAPISFSCATGSPSRAGP